MWKGCRPCTSLLGGVRARRGCTGCEGMRSGVGSVLVHVYLVHTVGLLCSYNSINLYARPCMCATLLGCVTGQHQAVFATASWLAWVTVSLHCSHHRAVPGLAQCAVQATCIVLIAGAVHGTSNRSSTGVVACSVHDRTWRVVTHRMRTIRQWLHCTSSAAAAVLDAKLPGFPAAKGLRCWCVRSIA